jgi:FMN phosphatase YigB (HAD superfamily)
LEPAELTLLDDRMENVLAAREAGWRSVLWDGTAPLSDLLSGDSR